MKHLTAIILMTLVSCSSLKIPKGYKGAAYSCWTQQCVDDYVEEVNAMSKLSDAQLWMYFSAERDYYNSWRTPPAQTIIIRDE